REDEDDGQRPEGDDASAGAGRQATGGRRQAAGGRRRGRRAQAATRGDGGRERESTGATCASAALRATAHVGHHGDASGPRPTALGPRPLAALWAFGGPWEGGGEDLRLGQLHLDL